MDNFCCYSLQRTTTYLGGYFANYFCSKLPIRETGGIIPLYIVYHSNMVRLFGSSNSVETPDPGAIIHQMNIFAYYNML